MNRYFDAGGRALALREELGRGGEGAVFALADPNLCAKIYHDPLSSDRAEKIRTMAAMRSDTLTSLAAWPLGLVTNEKAQPLGLVIPRVSGGKDVHKLYSPKSRRSEFMRADWRFLARAAANTARAFGAVHAAGCVIGDVNHGSVLVGQDATVHLIDCDSFQITAAGRHLLCEVGVETYTPPELQGLSFAGVVRSTNHDAFGLAVLIFHLLMMGRHPYSGRYFGAGDMPIAQAIQEHRFAYGARRAEVLMDRPPGAPTLDLLGPDIAALFERAFSRAVVSGGRPTQREWIAGLPALEHDLVQCAANQAHWRLRGQSACPWCKLEGATGLVLFPIVFQATTQHASLDLDALLRQVAAMRHPGPTPVMPTPSVEASSEAKALRKHNDKRNMASFAAALLGLISVMATGFAPAAFVIAPIVFFVIRAAMDKKSEIAHFRAALSDADRNRQVALAEWERYAGARKFEVKQKEMSQAIQAVKAISELRARKLDQLNAEKRRLQLHAFLDRFSIESAKISGVGAGRKTQLASSNVETAADITPESIRIPGFGPSTQGKLLSWRTELEKRFVFDPSRPVDQRDIMRVEQEVLTERKKREDAARVSFVALQQEHVRIAAVRQNMRPQIEGALATYAQAAANVVAIS